MKKRLLVFLSFICLILGLRAQTNVYHPFPDSNAVWIYNISQCLDPNGNPPCMESDNHIYYYILKGDTIYNSITYHKIILIDSSAYPPIDNALIFHKKAGIREDANRKIYYTTYSSTENLLYDFSKTNIGDTLLPQGLGGSIGTILSCNNPY
jgi:hypothetical protein